ncbi:hypothetical protein OUZ56_024235 [Daphnia magna]|uniref:Uncharacterized protein n=1 Tax=Daphnia magna TaxID=35525 RepID=A0ABR0B0E3_9CRUS|nr:hypothetical protein OUZ56_024235 [Daphnia magna]
MENNYSYEDILQPLSPGNIADPFLPSSVDKVSTIKKHNDTTQMIHHDTITEDDSVRAMHVHHPRPRRIRRPRNRNNLMSPDARNVVEGSLRVTVTGSNNKNRR